MNMKDWVKPENKNNAKDMESFRSEYVYQTNNLLKRENFVVKANVRVRCKSQEVADRIAEYIAHARPTTSYSLRVVLLSNNISADFVFVEKFRWLEEAHGENISIHWENKE